MVGEGVYEWMCEGVYVCLGGCTDDANYTLPALTTCRKCVQIMTTLN